MAALSHTKQDAIAKITMANRSETPKAARSSRSSSSTYRENLERLIKSRNKRASRLPLSNNRKAPVIDLMEALKRSLDARKPLRDAPKPGSRKKTARRSKAA